MIKRYKVIGVMSGTSLDGLDIAYCEFQKGSRGWAYEIKNAKTIAYTEERKNKLSLLMKSKAEELAFADAEFGNFIGEQINKFINQKKLKPHLISSHGHTIFHQPQRGFTLQIGSGASIYSNTKIPVVCDLRSVDVGFGGQGAPLVPIGDKLLFTEFDYCLNLGGISNLSFDLKGKRVAYDISPVNIVLNYLANKKGLPFDKGGKIASAGHVNKSMLHALNRLDYYKKDYPKSLGKEWIDQNVIPILETSVVSLEDKMATVVYHIAFQISSEVKKQNKKKGSKLLVTGGGAFNSTLIKILKSELNDFTEVIVPDKETVMFKEALIFAFLGVLRVRNEVNSLKSVTGATRDSIGGSLYGSFTVFS